MRELVHALGALSFNQRAALVMRELEGRSYAEIADTLDLSSSAVETLIFRARRAIREQLEGPLTCGEAEHALSRQLDGRLQSEERGRLRAHLRECAECATLARRERARRAALRSLGPLPLPASLTSWGGGGGAAVGTGIAAKAAAVVAAGAVAAGAGHEVADAVDRPAAAPRTELVAPQDASPSCRRASVKRAKALARRSRRWRRAGRSDVPRRSSRRRRARPRRRRRGRSLPARRPRSVTGQ